MKFLLFLAATVSMLVGFRATVHAQTVLNGSFESPAVPMFPGYVSGAGDSWTASSTTNLTVYSNMGTNPKTVYGQQYLYMNGHESISQTLSSGFGAGQYYFLSIGCADAGRDSYDQLVVTASGGASATQTFNIPVDVSAGVSNHVIPFQNYVFAFQVTSNAPVTLTLAGQTASNPYNFTGVVMDIDNITFVPEPSTWALLSLGAVAAGLLAWRRRRVGV